MDGFYLETRGRVGGEGDHELVSRVTPGIRYVSRSGRLQGSFDYAANLLYHVGRGSTDGGEVQNALNAAFLAEAVPNWAFIDARATISQQSISAFGQRSAGDSPQFNDNRTEVSTLTLSPYVHGVIGGLASYEVRLLGGATHTRADTSTGSRNSSASMSLTSVASGAIVGWGLSASQERVRYVGREPIDNSRIGATVSMTPAPEIRLSVNGGREKVEEGNVSGQDHTNTAGLALLWRPSPRTTFSGDITERYFGRAKHLSFSHRTQRIALSYAFSNDTASGADGLALIGQATLLQLKMNEARLIDLYPNPVEREQKARDELLSQGQNPNQVLGIGALISSFSVQRRQDFSLGWFGQRLTFGLQAYTSARSQLTAIASGEPLPAEAAREHGYSSTLSYKLTPQTSIAFGGSRAMVFDISTQPGNDLKSANISLTSQLGRRTTGQLGARYTVFNSTTDPYRETSLSGSISLQF